MKRLEEAAVVLGFPAATGQTGPEHRKRVRPIVLIHLCRHGPRHLIRSESYESCLIQPRNPKTSSLQNSPTRPSEAPHLEPERLHDVECLPSDHLSGYRTELFLLGHRVSCTPKRQ